MSQANLARQRILEVHGKLSEVFAALDGVTPLLDEPERGAALQLRADVADTLRRLGNLCAFLGAAGTGPAQGQGARR